ncbi:hypothetical protein [Sphingomonas oryzagri]|uniref:Uncharacterized protein n=1 Tax=Sphingomonas oryzagri TaxID=3042314 RepID=A0ABT6MZU7_9SPHN|nr:hypothetical protein [Sphingomonas oryzagri]MDH7637999.1 hypothetical protein [Sphingomonas oryzagri]
MVHVLASLAFTLVAFGALGLTVFLLMQDQDKIMAALGLSIDPAPRPAHRPVRVRTAGRWQAASATAARPWSAAA